MRILMISLDKGLVGGKILGDVIERHKKYGELVDALDIIVFCLSGRGLKHKEISRHVRAYPTDSKNKIDYVSDALRIARDWFKKERYDLVVTQDPYFTGKVGMELKKEFGAKLLVHFHGDFWGNPLGLKERWYDLLSPNLSKQVVAAADAIRVMSEGQKESLIRKKINVRIIKVISTPVDVQRFMDYPQDSKQLQSLKSMMEGRKYVLMVGRKDKVKGFDTLFKAMNKVIEIKGGGNVGLWLVGNYSRKEAQKMGLSPSVPLIESGNAESADLPAYYRAAYVAVLPSTSESFGKVLIEANACGKPVIATDTAGAREIIQNGYNGYIVRVGDYQALADKVLYLLDHPDDARQMGENGRKLVKEKFSDNTDRIVNFWKEIASKQ